MWLRSGLERYGLKRPGDVCYGQVLQVFVRRGKLMFGRVWHGYYFCGKGAVRLGNVCKCQVGSCEAGQGKVWMRFRGKGVAVYGMIVSVLVLSCRAGWDLVR